MTNRAEQNWPNEMVVEIYEPSKPVKPAKTYSVWYRTGGTLNFKWRLVYERYANVDLARECAEKIRRMGYPAHFGRTEEILSIGLPETFE